MPYGDYYYDFAAAYNSAQRSYDAKIREGQAEFQRNVDRRDFKAQLEEMERAHEIERRNNDGWIHVGGRNIDE